MKLTVALQLFLQTMRHSFTTHYSSTCNSLTPFTSHPCPLLTTLRQGKNVVSVKGGCIDGLDWAKAIHIWTKSAMVPIPEGSQSFEGESDYTDYGDTQDLLDQPLDQPVDLRGNGGAPGGGLKEAIGENASVAKALSGACELSG